MSQLTLASETEVQDIYNIKKVLEIARTNLVFNNFAQMDEVPLRSGNSAKWFSVGDIAVNTASIAGKASELNQDVALGTVSATIDWKGNDISWTEDLALESVIDLPPVYLERMGFNAAVTLDTLTRDSLNTALTATYANSKTSATLTSADIIDYNNIIDTAATLRGQNAPQFTHPEFGPVYVALISQTVWARMMKDATIRAMVQPQYAQKLFRGELGVVGGVAFIPTTQAPSTTVTGNNADISFFLGKGAYGVTTLPLATSGPKVVNDPTLQTPEYEWSDGSVKKYFDIVRTYPGDGRGNGAHGDRYAQESALAWKAAYAYATLNSAFAVKLVTAR